MKANELRIGNYIKGRFHTINGLEQKDFPISPWVINEIYESDKHDYEPIPITEEWLVRLGFDSNWFKGEFNICTTSEHEYYQLCYNSKENGFAYLPVVLKYVNQLQNLYFALTGEELELIDPSDIYVKNEEKR